MKQSPREANSFQASHEIIPFLFGTRSLSYLQGPATSLCPESDKSTPHAQTLLLLDPF